MRSGISVTSSPPEAEATEEGVAAVEEPRHPLADFADEVAEAVGGTAQVTFDTIKVTVAPEQWIQTLTVARDDLDLVSFSFLSAIDWSNDPAVGDPLTETLEEESFEVLCTVGDLSVGRRVTFSTRLGRETPSIASLVDVYAGANWHERECHEMFGIDFVGHPDLSHLYLPDSFIGNPLLKSYPLLSREVKPWPGKVDVEAMPEAAEEEAEEPAAADDPAPDEPAGNNESAAPEESAGPMDQGGGEDAKEAES